MHLTFLAWRLVRIKARNELESSRSHSFGLEDVDGCATGDVDQFFRSESGDYLLLPGFLRHELMLHVNVLLRLDVPEGQGPVPGETGPGIVELAIRQGPLQGILEAERDGRWLSNYWFTFDLQYWK